jgi:hypothetical protein
VSEAWPWEAKVSAASCSDYPGTHRSWTLRPRDKLSKRLIVPGKTFGDTLVGDTTSWYRVYLPPSHRVDRVLSFFSCRRNLDSPIPSTAGECSPPHLWIRRGTLACGRGDGGVPIPRRGHTLWYSICICALCPFPNPPHVQIFNDDIYVSCPQLFLLCLLETSFSRRKKSGPRCSARDWE